MFDLTDCPDSPLKSKRQKTLIENPEIIQLDDDDDDNDDDDDDDSVVIMDISPYVKSVPLVMFCGFSIDEKEQLKKVCINLN